MPCQTTLSLNPGGDNAMDNAVYASGIGAIIGIRGNRLFQCNASTGAIITQADIGTFGRNGCLAYDSGSNKIFCSTWNTPHYDIQLVGLFQTSVANRNLYRINPSTLAVELTLDITTTFNLVNGLGHANDMTAQEAGICAMDSSGGNIYCRWWGNWINGGVSGGSLRFSAANVATFTNGAEGVVGGYPGIVYASIGGHDNALFCDQQGTQEIVLNDYTAVTENTFHTANKNILAVGFAPVQQHVFITDVAQLIYVYSTAGASLTTINTGRANFNGLSVRFDATDGNIYVCGGNDNTIVQINPATNAFVVIPGFDCPVDYVRAGATRFAVQAGSTPLKAF
jgi:hypothetical protein